MIFKKIKNFKKFLKELAKTNPSQNGHFLNKK